MPPQICYFVDILSYITVQAGLIRRPDQSNPYSTIMLEYLPHYGILNTAMRENVQSDGDLQCLWLEGSMQ